MIRRLKEWRLAYGIRHGAEAAFEDGTISAQQRDRLVESAGHRQIMKRTLRAMETDPNLYGEIDWWGIWEWIRDNVIPVLKIVIPIAIMFLEPQDDE